MITSSSEGREYLLLHLLLISMAQSTHLQHRASCPAYTTCSLLDQLNDTDVLSNLTVVIDSPGSYSLCSPLHSFRLLHITATAPNVTVQCDTPLLVDEGLDLRLTALQLGVGLHLLNGSLTLHRCSLASSYDPQLPLLTTEPASTGNVSLRDSHLAGLQATALSVSGSVAISLESSSFRDCQMVLEAHSGASVSISDSVFEQNTGALLSVTRASSMSVTNSSFIDNTVATEGLLIIVSTAYVEILGSLFQGNHVGDSGGTIHVRETEITLRQCSFLANDGQYGAVYSLNSQVYDHMNYYSSNRCRLGCAAYMSNTTFTTINSTFEENTATEYSGVIAAIMSTIVIQDAVVSSNNAIIEGGAAYLENCSVIIRSSIFVANTAPSGGAIALSDSKYVSVVNTIFKNNLGMNGGAVFVNDGPISVRNSTFIGNIAEEEGGSILAQSGSFLDIEFCNFSSNSANRAAAVLVRTGTTRIHGSYFIGNHAITHTGAINTEMSSADISDSSFIANGVSLDSGSFAGAVNCFFCSLMIDKCNFTGNMARSAGGLIVHRESQATISNSRFEDNFALEIGGAISILPDCIARISNCTFIRNTNTAISVSASSLYLNNSVFTENENMGSFSFASAVNGKDGNIEIWRCRFERNNDVIDGSTVIALGTTIQLHDSVFYNNTGSFASCFICGRNCKAIVVRTNFTENESLSSEVLSYYLSSSGILSHCNIENNNAMNGDAIATITDSVVHFNDCRIRFNKAVIGPLMTIKRSDIRILRCMIEGNEALGFASIEILDNSHFNVSSSSITRNSALSTGVFVIQNSFSFVDNSYFGFNAGGALLLLGNAIVTNSTFESNSAENGGAIYYSTGALEVVDCVFRNNSARSLSQNTCGRGFGGAIYFDSFNCSTTLKNITFIENTATSFGSSIAILYDPDNCFPDLDQSSLILQDDQFDSFNGIGYSTGIFNLDVEIEPRLLLGREHILKISLSNNIGQNFILRNETDVSLTFSIANIVTDNVFVVSETEISFTIWSTTPGDLSFLTNISLELDNLLDCYISATKVIEVTVDIGSCPMSQGLTSVLKEGSLVYTCADCPTGKFSNSSSDNLCEDCTAGTFGNTSGRSECSRCPRGRLSAIGAKEECDECPPGRFSHVEGSSTCTVCPAGTFSSGEGSSVCLECLAGSFSREGRSLCTSCEAGFYAPYEGSSRCELCPDGSYASEEGSHSCTSCPPGAVTSSIGSRSSGSCICPEKFFGEPYSGGECSECTLTGFLCLENSSTPYVLEGYYRSDNPALSYICVPSEACDEGGYGSTPCSLGYAGELCSECSDGFYRSDLQCVKCNGLTVRVTFTIVALLIIGYALYRFGKKNKISIEIRIIVTSLQVISLYPSTSMSWPEEILGMFRLTSLASLNIDIFSVECAVSVGYWRKWLLRVFLPILCFFCVVFGAGVYHRFNGKDIPFSRRIPALLNAALFLMILLYTVTVSSLFEPLVCTSQPDGSYTMTYNASVRCFGDEWMSYLPIMISGMIAYLIVFPVYVGLILYTNRNNLDTEEFRARYQVLTKSYSPHAYYWELVSIAFKALIVLTRDFGRFLSTDHGLIFIIIAVLFIHLVIETMVVPYQTVSRNRLSFIWNVVSILTLLSAFAFGSSGVTETEILVYSILVTTIMLLAFCISGHHFLKVYLQNKGESAQQVTLAPQQRLSRKAENTYNRL